MPLQPLPNLRNKVLKFLIFVLILDLSSLCWDGAKFKYTEMESIRVELENLTMLYV